MQREQHARVPALAVLRDGNFRTLWYVIGLIETSLRLELLVLSLLILQTTDSPFQLGLVLVFSYVPRPVFSLFSGHIADRLNRHRILLAAQSLNTLTSAAILLLLMGDLIQPWHVFIAVFLQGTARTLEQPARRTGIFDIVGQRRVVSAVSLETISQTAGKMVGPLLGGGLLSVLAVLWAGESQQYAGAYAFAVLVHLLALGMLTRVRVPHIRSAARPESIRSSLGAATRFAFHTPILLGLLYITIVMNGMAFPAAHFIPAIGRNHLEVGPALIGILVATEGFGKLAAAGVIVFLRGQRYYARMLVVGSITSLAMLILFAWSPWYALSFAFLMLAGAGDAGFNTMQGSIILLYSPPGMRGRMTGLLSFCIGVGTPLGALEIGALASALSTQWAISLNAMGGLLLILPVVVLTRLVWQPYIERPAEPATG